MAAAWRAMVGLAIVHVWMWQARDLPPAAYMLYAALAALAAFFGMRMMGRLERADRAP